MGKGLTVLSYFDGMSCGQLALERLGIEVDRYIACEIDKHAIKVAKENFPDTVHMGSVTELGFDGESIYNWMGEVPVEDGVDLFIGGSPCQDFSFAGSRRGMVTTDKIEILSLDHYLRLKEEGFQFKGQSYLFWEFVKMKEALKPKYFLLENVKMPKKWQDLISSILGVEPVIINSALVSAQNRVRLYWTNIPLEGMPEDMGVVLRDILEDGISFTRAFEPKEEICVGKDGLIHVGMAREIRGHDKIRRVYAQEGKAPCLVASTGGSQYIKVSTPKEYFKQFVDRYKSLSLTATYEKGINLERYLTKHQRQIVFGVEEASSTWYFRGLTATECERLQTVPDGYTSSVSNTQRLKMLGNGWTIDVICFIFSHLKNLL